MKHLLNFNDFQLFEKNIEIKINDLFFKKIFSFKTEEGNFSTYDINSNHPSRPDMFTVWENKQGWIIRNSIIPNELQGKGIGTQFYIEMNKLSLLKTKKPLRSTQIRDRKDGTIVHELSKLGEKLWDSLVKKHLAIKISDKNYIFKK